MDESASTDKVKDFLEYLGKEEANLLVTFNNLRPEFDLFSKLDSLYRTAINSGRVENADDLVVMQLLLLVHYQYYHSTSTLLRCHLSDAFASMRIAIEAGLTAYRIIEDRPSQLLYVERDKSFRFPKSFFKKAWKKDSNAFPLARPLLDRWNACSEYGAHADINTFIERLELPSPSKPELKLQYFQHPKNRWEFGWYYLVLVHTFVIILQAFEKYLVVEKAFLPKEWAKAIPHIGKNVENLMQEAEQRSDAADSDPDTEEPQ